MWKGLTHTGGKERENGEIKFLILVHVTWHLSCSRCESLESYEKKNERKKEGTRKRKKEMPSLLTFMIMPHTYRCLPI